MAENNVTKDKFNNLIEKLNIHFNKVYEEIEVLKEGNLWHVPSETAGDGPRMAPIIPFYQARRAVDGLFPAGANEARLLTLSDLGEAPPPSGTP